MAYVRFFKKSSVLKVDLYTKVTLTIFNGLLLIGTCDSLKTYLQ